MCPSCDAFCIVFNRVSSPNKERNIEVSTAAPTPAIRPQPTISAGHLLQRLNGHLLKTSTRFNHAQYKLATRPTLHGIGFQPDASADELTP